LPLLTPQTKFSSQKGKRSPPLGSPSLDLKTIEWVRPEEDS
jgi:hypothetical protein